MDIVINNLTKTYRGDVHALTDVTLTIPSGIFGLLGPNGAGKTTLMRTLAGIVSPTEGSIRIGPYDGGSEQGRKAVKQFLGYLPQELGVYPDLSAREFLDYVAVLKGINHTKTRKQLIEALLALVSLSSVATRKLKTFSGGMQRRVGIAQALLNNPRLLIVDEPTAGLDPEERIRFRNLLSDLGSTRTVLLSTHIVEDIAQTCQRLAIMKSGRVIFQGTTSELVREAEGKVWTMTTQGGKPEGNLTVIATMNMGNVVQYRVVGDLSSRAGAVPVAPTLEDAYIWLMREQAVPAFVLV